MFPSFLADSVVSITAINIHDPVSMDMQNSRPSYDSFTATNKSKINIHHHHHQSLNREGRWGTTDDFATTFLHFSLFSTALWDLPDSRPVYSLMLSSHLFLCPPCLLPPFTMPRKMVLARPDEREQILQWVYSKADCSSVHILSA